jgi:Mg/Co/Ni transporter MgtE
LTPLALPSNPDPAGTPRAGAGDGPVTIVVVGSLIGMLLPFILTRFGMDPATASAPLITSLCDISGVLIYFSIATWLLGATAG